MASICLYDIDFLYSSSYSFPNFELMKVFNYHYKKGNIVVLGKKNEDFGRFNQVIFFKQSEVLSIPKHLKLYGEKNQIYGYGFYGRFKELKEEYQNIPPNFLIYDIVEDKIKNIKTYNKLKTSSIIRLENNDMSFFFPERKNIYIVDENIMAAPQSIEIIKEYKKKYNVNFYHSIRAKDENNIKDLFFISQNSNRRLVLDFDISLDIFKQYYNEPVVFNFKHKFDKDVCKFLFNFIILILYSKANNISFYCNNIYINSIDMKQYPILNLWDDIIKWKNDKQNHSFYSYCINNGKTKMFDKYLNHNNDFRLLLKSKPDNYTNQIFDF